MEYIYLYYKFAMVVCHKKIVKLYKSQLVSNMIICAFSRNKYRQHSVSLVLI